MLRTMCRQLDGQSVWLWLFDEADESFALRLAVEGDTVLPTDSHLFVRDPTLWKQNQVLEDVLFTGAPTIFEDIQTDPRMPVAYREYLKRSGTKKGVGVPILASGKVTGVIRSEEHTSELQSHLNLVCRLLLEKKKHHQHSSSQL